MTEKLRHIILETMGEASMCWETPEGAGVFQTERAIEIGERLIRDIKKEYEEKTK